PDERPDLGSAALRAAFGVRVPGPSKPRRAHARGAHAPRSEADGLRSVAALRALLRHRNLRESALVHRDLSPRARVPETLFLGAQRAPLPAAVRSPAAGMVLHADSARRIAPRHAALSPVLPQLAGGNVLTLTGRRFLAARRRLVRFLLLV